MIGDAKDGKLCLSWRHFHVLLQLIIILLGGCPGDLGQMKSFIIVFSVMLAYNWVREYIKPKTKCVVWPNIASRMADFAPQDDRLCVTWWHTLSQNGRLCVTEWQTLRHRMTDFALQNGRFCVTGWQILRHRMADFASQDGRFCVTGWQTCVTGWQSLTSLTLDAL